MRIKSIKYQEWIHVTWSSSAQTKLKPSLNQAQGQSRGPVKVLTDDVLDKYLDSCSDDEMQIISIRKDHHESSAANRIAEAYFHKLKRSQNTNVKIFLYSLSNADDVCPKSLLSSRLVTQFQANLKVNGPKKVSGPSIFEPIFLGIISSQEWLLSSLKKNWSSPIGFSTVTELIFIRFKNKFKCAKRVIKKDLTFNQIINSKMLIRWWFRRDGQLGVDWFIMEFKINTNRKYSSKIKEKWCMQTRPCLGIFRLQPYLWERFETLMGHPYNIFQVERSFYTIIYFSIFCIQLIITALKNSFNK